VTAARRRTIPVLRPPGAIDEPSFLAGCTRCELCIEACPHDAIVHAPARFREAAGTPMIDADHQPCVMCADYPCISACEPGVLSPLIPAMMGTARITEHLCLPHHGTSCTVCSENCPVENAIVISDEKPTVNEATCSGCGVCRSVCPAPENAILLMPMFLRPGPAEERQPHE
jgi:ferredoxin-type protein NapG